MIFKQSPCMGCAMRYIGCHSDCSVFKDWKSSENIKNAELKAKRSVVAGLCEASSSNYFTVMDKHHRDVMRGHYAW